MLEEDVARDGEEIGADPGVAAEAVAALDQAEEDLLGQVAHLDGEPLAHEEAVDGVEVPREEGLSGGAVPRAPRRQQRLVALVLVLGRVLVHAPRSIRNQAAAGGPPRAESPQRRRAAIRPARRFPRDAIFASVVIERGRGGTTP